MATLASAVGASTPERRYFLTMAYVIAGIIVFAFAFNAAMGRVDVAKAPLLVHAHGIVFMSWVALFVTQNRLVVGGNLALHRTLGLAGAALAALMIVLGLTITAESVMMGRVPFFFGESQFLMLDGINIIQFAALIVGAIALRGNAGWHKRLMLSAMISITGPAFGRLLPMPLLGGYAIFATFCCIFTLFAAAVFFDPTRRNGLHPAWLWGGAAIIATEVLIELLGPSAFAASLVTMLKG
jgi:hypothetical protein